MNTITIPKKMARDGDLMIVPRKEYEQLMRFWTSTEHLAPRDKRAIAKGLNEIAQGKFLTSKQVHNELGL